MNVTRAPFDGVFAGRRVLVTGHTGFKGAWLSKWLLELDAEVTGYALEPDTDPSLFQDLGLGEQMDSRIGDIRDAARLAAVVGETRPEVMLHLAAQPLVRRSYAEPAYTFEVNVLGTTNLLEAARTCDSTRVVVNVTTDKVYANPETGQPFDEEQPLGGHDPYSASKAASEIVTASYRASFFSAAGAAAIASARAGNVVGGGDWAEDRLVPDCARALSVGAPVVVRNPSSVRPWQHVLEPLSGYLHLAALLWSDAALAGAYNFGPQVESSTSVGDVVERFVAAWGAGSWHSPDLGEQPHEAAHLRLDISKSARDLSWRPVWDLGETVDRTAKWYRAYAEGENASNLVESDFDAYISGARLAGAAWTGQGEARD